MPMTKPNTEQEEARDHLREILKPGDTVHTILRHVSRSGMSRSIDLVIVKDGEPDQITYWAAKAMGDKIDQTNGGIKMGGAGMDMGFAVVYQLAQTLWPNGFDCIATDDDAPYRSCPSNDHNNHPRDKFAHHSSGGYALNQHWM